MRGITTILLAAFLVLTHVTCHEEHRCSNGNCTGIDDSPGQVTLPVNAFLAPDRPGPYLVGNTSFFFEDSSRPLSCGQGNRILLTEVWYPAGDSAAQWPEATVLDFFLGRSDEVAAAMGASAAGQINDLPTGCFRDAPLNLQAPPLPIIFFSHGMLSNRFQNFTMAVYLASHGYLVVAPDHICSARATLTPDEVVTGSLIDVPFSLPDRISDIRFLIDLFTSNPPEIFAHRLDKENIGLWGHSFGGITMSELFKTESRAKALLQMTAFGFPGETAEISAATMVFWGEQDKLMHLFKALHEQFFEQMPAPRYALTFPDTGHFAFSDLCQIIPMIGGSFNGCISEGRIGSSEDIFTNPDHASLHAVLNAYATAFLGAAFYGLPELDAYLAENHFPDMMDYHLDLNDQ